eukprot:NODE_1084_length_1364_cov_0.048221.p2 type:complete len:135 gc:universal NODE_1084_length_1364_cov_0.048221:80-484(+)
MAPQLIYSARYWGEIVSKSSQATGIPISVKSCNNCLAIFRPLLILKLSLSSGSFIRPFHPTVVLGFSKYVRMHITNSSLNSFFNSNNILQYSLAAIGSWIEHGPTITKTLSQFPLITSIASILPCNTVFWDLSD